MMKHILFLTACLIIICGNINGQNQVDSIPKHKTNNGLSLRYHWGSVLKTNDFLKGENQAGKPIDYYQALSLSYMVQTDGSKSWHHIYNFPSFGASFYTADFFNDDELGKPNALYGFISLPFIRNNKSIWGYELGLGLTSNWNSYDKYTNPYNIAIGSDRTVFIDANLFYTYHIDKRWDIRGSFGFTHFSNGGTKKPNSGINLLSPSVAISYNFKDRPLLIKKIQPKYKSHNEIALQIGAGGKHEIYENPNMPNDTTTYKGVDDRTHSYLNFSAAYLKQITWRNKFGAGVDLTYDETANSKVIHPINGNENPEVIISDKFNEKFMVGVYGTYEFTIDRLSIATYMGYLIYRKEISNQSSKFYQKFGVKYHLKNNMYAGLLVRANNFSVAEVIEWNIGYRIKWN